MDKLAEMGDRIELLEKNLDAANKRLEDAESQLSTERIQIELEIEQRDKWYDKYESERERRREAEQLLRLALIGLAPDSAIAEHIGDHFAKWGRDDGPKELEG